MSIACERLPSVNGKFPDTFASIHYATSTGNQWVTYARTEIVEVCVYYLDHDKLLHVYMCM